MRSHQLISFFEVDSNREVRLGSGSPINVKCRKPGAPFLRVLQLDSQSDGRGMRARFGRLRVDEDGIREVEEPDMMVFRGSSADVFFVLPALAYALDLNKVQLLETFGDLWDFHWFSYSIRHPRKINRIDVDTADFRLRPESRLTGNFVVHFGGMASEFSEMIDSLSVLKKVLNVADVPTSNSYPC